MHYSIVRYILGMMVKVEAVLMLLPVLVGLIYREKETSVFVFMVAVCGITGYLLSLKRPEKFVFYAREGIVSVSLTWIVISIFGALPFVLTGEIPRFTDALFETVSGFTTTGASIMRDVEILSHASQFWRCFTHWVGGMGVIVFMLAILPMTGGYNAQLMRAESPGPSFGKLVPKVRETAKILYQIYLGMTLAEMIILYASGMPLFDTICISFGSAGTGGFGVWNTSCGSYTTAQQAIITVFILLFGVNFSAYFILLGKKKSDAFRLEEVRWYFIFVAAAIMAITFNIRHFYESFFYSLHHASFQVASIVTTTGFSTADFDAWPMLSRMILVLLMFVGACAGSTGGGFKVARVLILGKTIRQQIQQFIHPRSVSVIKVDGKAADKDVVKGVNVYLATYIVVFIVSVMLLALDPLKSFTTDFTAVAATINNIGPGLEAVGPTMNYADMSILSKYVLIFDMLAGRLELYPMLLLFAPDIWRRN